VSLPMATRIVHIKIVDPPSGTVAAGTVRFRLRYALHDATDNITLSPYDYIATLGTTDDRAVKIPALVAGEAYIALPVNDEAGVTPTGWSYEAQVRTSSWVEDGLVPVPSGAGTLEFSDVFPSATAQTVNTYATVGQLSAEETARIAADAAHADPLAWAESQLVDTVQASLNLSCRYQLVTWIPATYPGTGAISSWGGSNEVNIRPPAAAVFGIACCLASGYYDSSVVTVSAVDATAQVVRLASSLAATHKATAGGGGWGGGQTTPPPASGGSDGDWQGALWAFLAGAAGWLVWSSLTGTQQTQIVNMIVWEANRMLLWTPPYWRNTGGTEIYAGDSKSEEIAWDATVLVLARVLSPSHANAFQWQSKLIEAGIAAYAIPADLVDSSSVNGFVVNTYLGGTNMTADGLVINHDRIHPDYIVSAASSLYAALVLADRAGITLPVAVDRHADLLYRGLTDVTFFPPTYASPGGSIYPWPASENFYYPQGNDWGTERTADKATFDVLAHRYGWDRALNPSAITWARIHMLRQAGLMARSATGQTYISAGEDTYQGREQWVTHHLGAALLALVAPAPQPRSYENLKATGSRYGDAIAQLAPALWWRLDETSGTTFADTSINDRDGAYLLGSGYTLGVSSCVPSDATGKALRLRTTGTLITRANESWMNTVSMTILLAIRSAAPTGAEQNVFSVRVGGSGATGANRWAIGIVPTTGYARATVFDGAQAAHDLISTVPVCNGANRLLALVITGSGASLYVDGTLALSNSGYTPTVVATAPLVLGGRYNNSSGGSVNLAVTNVDVDEAVILAAALDATAIASLYSAFTGP
jgi:hypothetical protein